MYKLATHGLSLALNLKETKVEQINEALYMFAFPLQIGDEKIILLGYFYFYMRKAQTF